MSGAGRRCRRARRPACFLFTGVLFFAGTHSTAASPDTDFAYRDALLERVESLRLYEHSEWLALGHYETESNGRIRSLARGENFFLSPYGVDNPEAELRETLVAFFDPERTMKDGEHPQCALRARHRWLVAKLDIDTRRMPAPGCERYDRWRSGLAANGLTMVFPEAYMNNPASMFGHTLLRVDSGAKGEQRDLLAYAINFAAEAGGDGGAAFAFKGIFGGYAGYFSVLPYYEKLKQYGDWENRDIWEYPLTLDEDEIDMLLAHVWELRGVPFPYFFFDDNCSYQLLSLLEVARPKLRLRRQFPLWAIPIDTVRVISEQTSLIEGASYRPSPATRIRYAGKTLSTAAVRVARDLATGVASADGERMAELAASERGAALALAYTYLRFLYLSDAIPKDESAPRSRELLEALSRADSAATPLEPPTPGVSPEHGHAMASIGAGGGVRDEDGFVSLTWRAVFHSLSDPAPGYAEGANLEIMRSTLHYEPERGKLRVDEIAALDVTSITARDALLRPVSWAFGTGWRTRMLSDGSGDGVDPRGVAYLDGGAGLAYSPVERVLGYGLFRAIVEAAPALEKDFAVAPALELGVLARTPADLARTRLSFVASRYVWGDTTTPLRAASETTVSLSDRVALVFEVGVEHAYGETWADATLSWRTYFRRKWDE